MSRHGRIGRSHRQQGIWDFLFGNKRSARHAEKIALPAVKPARRVAVINGRAQGQFQRFIIFFCVAFARLMTTEPLAAVRCENAPRKAARQGRCARAAAAVNQLAPGFGGGWRGGARCGGCRLRVYPANSCSQ